jgi:hypothetical protein
MLPALEKDPNYEGRTTMDTPHYLTSAYTPIYSARSYWDLYVSASLILLAYHSCEPGRKSIPAIYDRAARQYICPDCLASHSTRIGETDRLLSPTSDKGYYVSFMD